jgi:uncharacterized protein (DUF58 family)
MIPREVLEKVRRIEITTRSMVRETFAGHYSSIFKGRGMEFDEVREYQPGDDIRTIDWNVTARTGWLHVKKYVEERELTVLIIFEAGAVLAFSAIRNNDKVGLLIFTDKIEGFIPPRKGTKHVLRIIREILHFKPSSRGTNISQALEYAMRVVKRHSVMFVISDFRDEGYERALTVANRKHDVVAVTVGDPSEYDIPPVGLIEVEDGETAERVVLDLRNERSAGYFRGLNADLADQRKSVLSRARVDEISLGTERDYAEPMVRFFRERERRFKWRY